MSQEVIDHGATHLGILQCDHGSKILCWRTPLTHEYGFYDVEIPPLHSTILLGTVVSTRTLLRVLLSTQPTTWLRGLTTYSLPRQYNHVSPLVPNT